MKAFLILEDGTVFEGNHIGACHDVVSEIVFDTSMGGYVEVLTDPSYEGQTVCMTYPLIGNYGVSKEDMESEKAGPAGLIVRELSGIPSNFRSDMTIQQFLEEQGIAGIAGIDTRALTKILREKGTMNGMITTDTEIRIPDAVSALKKVKEENLTDRVTCSGKYTVSPGKTLEENGPVMGSSQFDPEAYRNGVREPKPSPVKVWNGEGLKVAVLDLGIRRSILDGLKKRGCECTVYPAHTGAEEILAAKPDGILISNGPGNPKACDAIIKEVGKLYESDRAVLAVGLGHQLMALATGADTFRMKHGHRGCNYPVRELKSGKVYISAQNHGYAVDEKSLDPAMAVPAFENVNDGTVEGLCYPGKNILSAQHYPDPYLGPKDEGSLFDRFITMMREGNCNA